MADRKATGLEQHFFFFKKGTISLSTKPFPYIVVFYLKDLPMFFSLTVSMKINIENKVK